MGRRGSEQPFSDLLRFESTNTVSRDKLNYETGTAATFTTGTFTRDTRH